MDGPGASEGGDGASARGSRAAPAEAGTEERWTEGEQAAARGRAGDPGGFSECARIFSELAASLRGDARAPVALWSAAICAEEDHRPGEALALMARIVERWPRGELEEAALRRLAGLSLAMLRFEEAAMWHERRAELYPGGVGVMEGLETALAVRIALGQVKEARRDLGRVERLFGHKAPERVAEIAWRAGAMATTEAERAAHAEAYLRRYAKTGGLDRAIVAEVRLAMIEANRSCPLGLVTGLCVGLPAKVKGSGRRCAEPLSLRPRPRSAAKVESARRRLAGVEEAMRRPLRAPADDPRRAVELAEAVAMARLLALDLELEAFLGVEMPRGLRLAADPAERGARARRERAAREASMRRVREFMRALEVRWSVLARGYEALVAEKQSRAAMVAAAHRRALLDEHVAEVLASADVPREIGDKGVREVFCRALDEAATPHRERARAAYRYCAERAVSFHEPSAVSEACEAALARIDRREWPPLLEFVGEVRPWGELPPRGEAVRVEMEAVEMRAAAGEGE